MSQVLAFFADTYNRIFVNSFVTGLVLLIFLYFFLRNEELKYWQKDWMGITLVILVLVIFNPIIGLVLTNMGYSYDYRRIYWLLPNNVIFAYVLMDLWLHYEKADKRVLIVLAALAAAVICWSFAWNLKPFVKAENSLHISEEVVRVADIIMEDEDRENKLVVVPDALSWSIRSYQPQIKILNGYLGWEHYYEDYVEDQELIYYHINQNPEPDVKFVGEWVRMYDFVYIVWEKGKVTEEDMKAYLYDLVDSTEHYEVYAVRKDILK